MCTYTKSAIFEELFSCDLRKLARFCLAFCFVSIRNNVRIDLFGGGCNSGVVIHICSGLAVTNDKWLINSIGNEKYIRRSWNRAQYIRFVQNMNRDQLQQQQQQPFRFISFSFAQQPLSINISTICFCFYKFLSRNEIFRSNIWTHARMHVCMHLTQRLFFTWLHPNVSLFAVFIEKFMPRDKHEKRTETLINVLLNTHGALSKAQQCKPLFGFAFASFLTVCVLFRFRRPKKIHVESISFHSVFLWIKFN